MKVNEEERTDLSNVTINGVRFTWQQLYEHEHALRLKADEWGILVSDLDRCVHGRHQGDVCSSCGGPSVGNELLPVGTVVGHDLGGHAYVAPPREQRHRIDAWRTP